MFRFFIRITNEYYEGWKPCYVLNKVTSKNFNFGFVVVVAVVVVVVAYKNKNTCFDQTIREISQ